jgi:hypothetical protein
MPVVPVPANGSSTVHGSTRGSVCLHVGFQPTVMRSRMPSRMRAFVALGSCAPVPA